MDVCLKLVESVWDVEWPASDDFERIVEMIVVEGETWRKNKKDEKWNQKTLWMRYIYKSTLQKCMKCMRNINTPLQFYCGA